MRYATVYPRMLLLGAFLASCGFVTGNETWDARSLVSAHDDADVVLDLEHVTAGRFHSGLNLQFRKSKAFSSEPEQPVPVVNVGMGYDGPVTYEIGPNLQGRTFYLATRGGTFLEGTGRVDIEEGGERNAHNRVRGTVDVVFDVNGERLRLLKGFDVEFSSIE